MLKRLRIGIDCHILGKQKGGVETVVEILVRGLAKNDSENTYFLYVTGKHPFRPGDLPPNFHLRPLASSSPAVGRLLLLPYYYRRDRLDLIHVQRATSLFGCRHTLLHVHDAMYATSPQLFPSWKRAIFNRLFRWSGSRATLVVTPTEASKAEIVRHYAIDPAKIHVLPAANLCDFGPAPDPSQTGAVLAGFRVHPPYVIFLGATERNKNIHVLLDAFAEFAQAQPAWQLVLVGKWRAETRGGYVEELERQMSALGIRDKVVVTGWVTNQQRRLLLGGAAMLVFPSSAEGIGLPPIEAMACGVPVIASDLPSIREFYGDSLLTCRVNDPSDLARQMLRLASDAALAAQMTAKGSARASRDRWDSQAVRLLEIYRFTAGVSPLPPHAPMRPAATPGDNGNS
jgi:glycosyltransferase involved in cell wall biosynthesis